MKLIIQKALTMTLGLFASLGLCFSRLRSFILVTGLWVLLFPIGTGFVGIASNQLVLIANHDKFPVMLNELRRGHAEPDANGMIDSTHCVMTKQTDLNLLADIFDFHSEIESVGDLLIDFGSWLWGFAPFVWGFEVVRRLRS